MDSTEPLKKLINKRKYKEAEELAKKTNTFNELIDLLTNNRHAKQATLILKSNNIPLDKYPALLERLRKRYVRYVLDTVPMQQAEVRFLGDKNCLAVFAEDLCYKKAINESLSLVKRHNLNSYIVKDELRQLLDTEFDYIENEYLMKDGFGRIISSDGAMSKRGRLY